MGNVHSVLQIEPRYFEGAAIEIPRGHWDTMARLYAERPHHVPNVLIKEFEDDFWVFCDEAFHELRRFLVIQDGGKSGYEQELPELMATFAPCLEDAEFYVDDEYQGYVERFRISRGRLEVERVVDADGEAFEYLDRALVDRPEAHLRLLVGKAGALMRSAGSWDRLGAGEAARDDRETALALLSRACERSTDWRIHHRRGALLIQLGRYSEAREVLEAVQDDLASDVVLDQRAARQVIQVSLGVSASGLGDKFCALEHFHQAAELRSMNTGQLARTNEAVTLLHLGRPDEAAIACRQALAQSTSLDEAANALYNLACALALTGQRGEALKALWAAIHLRPAFAKSAAADDDLAALRGDPDFEDLTSESSERMD